MLDAARNPSPYPVFAAVLSKAMIKAGITPSEAARRVWGTAKDKRGYVVARNRDRIGHYLAGTSYPNDENLHKLADVLGVPVDTLAVETRARSSGRPQRQTPHVGDATPPGPGGPQASSGLLRTTMPTAPEPLRLARFEVDRMISPELAITLTQMILKEDQHRASAVEAEADENKRAASDLGKIVGGTDLQARGAHPHDSQNRKTS